MNEQMNERAVRRQQSSHITAYYCIETVVHTVNLTLHHPAKVIEYSNWNEQYCRDLCIAPSFEASFHNDMECTTSVCLSSMLSMYGVLEY